jgi:hypothetical protein
MPIDSKEQRRNHMLQNIVFQDNIYQLARTADLLKEGLLLDLAGDYFYDKFVDDILFLDVSIQKLSAQILSNSRISSYIAILHSLRSCQERYIDLLTLVLSGKSGLSESFANLLPKIQTIKNTHLALSAEIQKNIQKKDANFDSRDMVSQNELSELLHF